MTAIATVGCSEFVITWVPSGVFLSLEPGSVPSEVWDAPPVPGLHLVHMTPTMIGSEVPTQALLAQPLHVLARMVDAPPSSVTTGLDMAAAIARADALRLPVRVPGVALAGAGGDRALPIDAQGKPATSATAAYVLILPASHLVAEHTTTVASDTNLGRVLPGPPMPGQVRWVDERAEVGLPRPIVNARYSDVKLITSPAGQTHTLQGGIVGLWRALADLTPGQTVLVHATTTQAEATENLLAIRAPDGIALLRHTPTGAQAASLPRNPTTLHLTPATAIGTSHERSTGQLSTPNEAAVSMTNSIQQVQKKLSPSLIAAFGLELEIPGVTVPFRRGEVLAFGEGWKLEPDQIYRSVSTGDIEFVLSPMSNLSDIKATLKEVISLIERIRLLALASSEKGVTLSAAARSMSGRVTIVRDATFTVSDIRFQAKLQATYGIGLDKIPQVIDELLTTTQAHKIHEDTRKVAQLHSERYARPLARQAEGFVELINMYRHNAAFKGPRFGGEVNTQFRLMARSDFTSIYERLLDEPDRRDIERLLLPSLEASAPPFMEALSLDSSDPLFKQPYLIDTATQILVSEDSLPRTIDWLASIVHGREDGVLKKDLLSPPPGYPLHSGNLDVDYGMGTMGVDEKNKLILFEVRGRPKRPDRISMNGRIGSLIYDEYLEATRYNASLEHPGEFSPSATVEKNTTLAKLEAAYGELRRVTDRIRRKWNELTANWGFIRAGVVSPTLNEIEELNADGSVDAGEVLEPGRLGRLIGLLKELREAPTPLASAYVSPILSRYDHELQHFERELWEAGNEIAPDWVDATPDLPALERRPTLGLTDPPAAWFSAGSGGGAALAAPAVPGDVNASIGEGGTWVAEFRPQLSGRATSDDALTEDVIFPLGSHRDGERSNLSWVGGAPSVRLRQQIRMAAAGFDGQVIFLGPAGDAQESVQNVGDVRRLVQQFAFKQQQPVVVTQGQVKPLKSMSATYGFSIVHRVAKSQATTAGGIPALAADPVWRVDGGNGTAEEVGASFVPPLLTSAAARAKPVTDSTSRALAKLLLAPNRAAKLNVLATYREQLASQRARDDLATIVQRVDADPWFRQATPLLGELGAPDAAEFVLDFQKPESSPVERAHLLMNERGRGIDVGLRVDLIRESGYSDTGAATALTAVDLLFTDSDDALDNALKYVKDNSADLPADARGRWVDSITELAKEPTHIDKRDALEQLAHQVLTC
ncbi:hypothetical protein ACLQ24_15120 [Micromonospora sp. DT4]|uniref:hypothetical protein n=1 Tax=Micromonospora sp. DT4 TaxID=3393438 RepID=UPI003CEF9748